MPRAIGAFDHDPIVVGTPTFDAQVIAPTDDSSEQTPLIVGSRSRSRCMGQSDRRNFLLRT